MLIPVEHSMQQNLTHLFQSTTVLSYHPILADKPLSCNLNHCEMFSCILGMEDETALSIIDPVTVNMDVTHRLHSGTTRGIPDAAVSQTDRVLEVSLYHCYGCIVMSQSQLNLSSCGNLVLTVEWVCYQ